MRKMKLEMKEFLKKQLEETNKVTEPAQADINEEEREQDREQKNIRNKQNNLIMFKVPESNDVREKDKVYYDYDKVDQVIRNELEINNIEIPKVVRLKGTGELTDRNGTIIRPHPNLLVLDSPQKKWNVLKSAKYLKQCHEDFQQVGIAPDLS